MTDPFRYLQRATIEIQHIGRPFYEHLKGTYDLLKRWHKPEHVCLAGLYHSVYDDHTNRTGMIRFTPRQVIRDMIGVEAEALAYLFCTSPDRLHRFMTIPEPTRTYLLDIEAADLLEQHAYRSFMRGVC